LRDRAADLLLERPPGPETLLGQLLARGSSGKQLLDQLVTLVVGGHQSTAAAITFTLYLLAKHPSEAREVTDEATSVLNGRAATIDDLPALPRTAMVVAESLRLFPPVWIIMRRTVGVQHLGSGALPSGTVVHISPHTLHRHPTHWPEPERFLPDRFADTRGQHRFAYAPFGAGPHKCVGNHFALMATAIVVATVIPAVQFSPPVPEVSVATRSFTIPDGGLRLRIGHRSR